jgi:hypothetical protein
VHADGFITNEIVYSVRQPPRGEGSTTGTDKTLAFIEGASHVYTTCRQCEKMPGQYGDTQKTLYDYADKWLNQKGRF